MIEVDSDQIDALVGTLNDISHALDRIGDGVGSPDYIDAPDNLTEAAENIARQLKWLGNGDAATPMGAIEAHGEAIKAAADTIYAGLRELGEAITASSRRIAEAVAKR